MNLNPHRPWITPLVFGAFLLSAVTGTLMFFHLDSGLNKLAHEWLSWLLLAAIVLHVLLNLPAFKRYFKQPTARWILLAALIVLAPSFFSLPGRSRKPEPAFAPVVHALAQAPLPLLAQVAGLSTEELQRRLDAAGLKPQDDRQSLQDLVGPEPRAQMGVLRRVLPAAQP